MSDQAGNKDDVINLEIPTLLSVAKRDRIYATKEACSFAFGEEVANVFDDMISRSVPYYLDLQILIASAAAHFWQEGSAVYDLGCSTGTSLALIAKRLSNSAEIYGIDSSQAMLAEAHHKLESLGVLSQVTLQHACLQEVEISTSSFITANYTLQFLPKEDRKPLLKKIYDKLILGGAFLISEKTEPSLPKEQQKLVRILHEDYKRQSGYTASEVARKRESLKGVMLPIDERENEAALSDAGFKTILPLMRGYSFMSWLCIKE